MDEEEQVSLSTTEARAGDTPHIVRYVLGFSLALAVAAMIVAYWAA